MATAVTLIAFGHLLGTTSVTPTVQLLQHDNDDLRRKAETAESENTLLKRQLFAAPNASSSTQAVTEPDGAPQPPAQASKADVTQAVSAQSSTQEATVSAGSSASLFGGSVTVSVIAIPFEADPLRHRVIGTVTAQGVHPSAFEHADVGATVDLGGYTVQIVSVGYDTATFRATRKSGA